MQNRHLLPVYIIRLTEISALSLALLLFCYMAQIIKKELFESKPYKALMVIITTIFMITNIVVEIEKLYNFTYDYNIEYRLIYIALTIAVAIFFYFAELKR